MMIGKRISEIRAEKGLSQEELAELTGLSKKTIGRWERGETMPSTNDLEYLLEKLNVSHGEFFGESAQTEVVKAASVISASNEAEANEQCPKKIEEERKSVYIISKRKMSVIKILLSHYAVLLVILTSVFLYYLFFWQYIDYLILCFHAKMYIECWGEVLFAIGSLIIVFCLIALLKIKRAGRKKP